MFYEAFIDLYIIMDNIINFMIYNRGQYKNKMENIRLDILWNEIIPFAPRIYFTLESTCKSLKERLCHDQSYIGWLLKEKFSRQNVS